MDSRISETDRGIDDAHIAEEYDKMLGRFYRFGFLNAQRMLRSGICGERILEIGPGPGYVGFSLLRKLPDAKIIGLEISPAMIEIARKNADRLGFSDRAEYVLGDAKKMPFEDDSFDSVISVRSLHEWAEPKRVFSEIARVLAPGGRAHIEDLRRDMSPFVVLALKTAIMKKELIDGLVASIKSSYTVDEVISLLPPRLKNLEIKKISTGLMVSGATTAI